MNTSNEMNISKSTALEIADKIAKQEIRSQDVVTYFCDRIKKYDSQVNSFLEVLEESALLQAKNVDEKIKSGKKLSPLAGIPIAIKDNICVEKTKTTCASKILKNFVAPYDATVIEKLRTAGMIFIGKTNLDEFAMGSSTENSAFFTTKNPWNLSYIPGGSSGGSAASVAARFVPLSLGSDTGGSIRQPASLCGTLGLKPTYGRVSRYGLIAFASSLDQIGPFTNDAKDMAALLEIISGFDEKDSTSSVQPIPHFLDELTKDIKGKRIGLPKEFFAAGLDPQVKELVLNTAKVFEKLGCHIEEVSLPHAESAIEVYYILAPSEASSNLARFDGIRYGHRTLQSKNLSEQYEKSRDEGFGPEVKRRIMLGTYALSSGYYDAYYAKAQKVRTLICQDFENVYKKVDVLLTPTAPTPAFKCGEKSSDPLQMYLSDIYTISCNLAGIPGLSIPCGFSKEKLPIGVQLLGRPFEEAVLLQMAHHYQLETSWHKMLPPAGDL